MFSFVIISAIYWIFCVAWFSIVQKPMFGLYNRRLSTRPVKVSDIADVYRHGFLSDAIFASYLTALPLLVGTAATMIPGLDFASVMLAVNIIISLTVGLLATADTALYPFWKFKLDSSVFAYLRSLKGATASVSTLYLVGAVGAWFCVSASFFIAVWGACRIGEAIAPIPVAAMPWWGHPVVLAELILAAALLFAVIRGLGIRPNNPSVAYFSNNQFLNHWALNPGYNLVYSMITRNDFYGQFRFMDAKDCDALIGELFPASERHDDSLIRTRRPNIIFIVWESLGAEMTGILGGKEKATPNLDKLAEEGILFSNCTAGSFRTDRGLVCLLSGYPAQPTTSIIRYTRKLPNLPGLPKKFKELGYKTLAIHGGDLSIMHKSDYYLACGHDTLIGQKDFQGSADKCKWGVHDGPLMDRVAEEALKLTRKGEEPWFMTVQTLSSHEPFEVPEKILSDKSLNAFAYSDRALGRLINRLKGTPVWDNLLIVVAADHGLNIPRPTLDRRSYAHIPVVIGGGAVRQPAVIDTMMSQTDIASTLLGQLGIDNHDFIFSRDVLAPGYSKPFGLHIFGNGIMMSDPDGYTLYDTMLEKVIEGDTDPERLRCMKAILQKIYEDLDKR